MLKAYNNKMYRLSLYIKCTKLKSIKANSGNFFLFQNSSFFIFNLESLFLQLRLISLIIKKKNSVFFISTETQFNSIVQIAALSCNQSFLSSKEYIQGIFGNNKQEAFGVVAKNIFVKAFPNMAIVVGLTKKKKIIEELKKNHIFTIGFIPSSSFSSSLTLNLPGYNQVNYTKFFIYFTCNFISHLIRYYRFN